MSIVTSFLWGPFLLQGVMMAVDEFYFHHRRGLPRWERLGHPLDSLTFLLCIVFTVNFPFTEENKNIFLWISIFSCLFVTKDEFIHKKLFSSLEHWLHSLLFILHPIVLICAYHLWKSETPFGVRFLIGQMWILIGFLIYQTLYWNILWKKQLSLPQ